MRVCLLASGSNGNCCWVEHGDVRLLIDIGIGPRVLARRLEPLGVTPTDLTHLLITHEHVDHIRGLEQLLGRQPDLRVRATAGTRRCLPPSARQRTSTIRAGRGVRIGDLSVMAFETSHDATEPVGYRLEGTNATLGYVTDLGKWDASTVKALRSATALIVEANHCPAMLAAGPYDADLKRRVASPVGHLSNEQCCELLEQLLHPGLRHVTLAHLSGVNNTPETAAAAVREVLDSAGVRWAVGSRSAALPPLSFDAGALSDPEQQLTLPLR